ncbi:MAG: hypothetical protein WBY88_11500 [Desulfosarcina sp.]
MSPFLAEKKVPWPAPCRGARHLLVVALLASVLAVLLVAGDLLLRTPLRDDATAAWMNTLKLTTPALWPAGSPARHPETLHPAVELRFSPGLEAAP